MTITISAEQREALYAQIFDRLDAVCDLRMAAHARKFNLADRLGRAYADDLQLLCADLGWGEGTGQPVALSTSAEALRRVFNRIGTEASEMLTDEEEKAARLLQMHDRHRVLIDLCRQGLEQLDAHDSSGHNK